MSLKHGPLDIEDVYCDNVAATLYRMGTRTQPLRFEMATQHDKDVQCILVGPQYSDEILQELGEQPWFLSIETRRMDAQKLLDLIESEGWVLRDIHGHDEAVDELDPRGYVNSLGYSDVQGSSAYLASGLAALAGLISNFGLSLVRIERTAQNVMRVVLVGDDILYRIDLEGQVIQDVHVKLWDQYRPEVISDMTP